MDNYKHLSKKLNKLHLSIVMFGGWKVGMVVADLRKACFFFFKLSLIHNGTSRTSNDFQEDLFQWYGKCELRTSWYCSDVLATSEHQIVSI